MCRLLLIGGSITAFLYGQVLCAYERNTKAVKILWQLQAELNCSSWGRNCILPKIILISLC